MTAIVPATLAFARGPFARGTDVFGAEEITKALGIKLAQVPAIPFSEAELTRARELGQYLILQANTGKDGKPLTMKKLHGQLGNKLGDGKLLYHTDRYKDKVFFTEDAPTSGWKLVSREVIPGSTSENYIGQTQAIAEYLVGKVFKGEELPDEYQAAVDEFNSRKAELEELRWNDWKCAEECSGLKLNQLFREKPVEVLYGLIVQHEVNHERLLGVTRTWTNQRSSGGDLVSVGLCASCGVRVGDVGPDYSRSYLGVRFFRRATPNLES